MNRAAVYIPEKLFFKIGEVCDITGVQAHVLRYWESEFPMLAPQKNRAGQRTYRKRDVEMVLRIKELLYEDQYTIAGAKKKLTSDIRGTSKLKVVTPEMSAAHAAEQQYSQPPPQAPEPTAPTASAQPASPPTYASDGELPPPAPNYQISDDRREALRRLREQMSELLTILDKTDAALTRRPK
ncbi:MAG TPA: MerR family transcriptional regulator [Pyrinomonadaceae bacterium]|jgi:DNA-binding transcriptional MerR regulator|nr:MerR family transcriptional regulator [Pyrinomonadaceae bacterium]